MTPWQRELERRTWANKHRKMRKRKCCFAYIARADDGIRQDLLNHYGIVELAHIFVVGDRGKRSEMEYNLWKISREDI